MVHGFITWPAGIAAEEKQQLFLKNIYYHYFFKKNCFPIKVVLKNTFEMMAFFKYELAIFVSERLVSSLCLSSIKLASV